MPAFAAVPAVLCAFSILAEQPSSARPAADASDEVVLAAVIVTALRREEDLQTIPAAAAHRVSCALVRVCGVPLASSQH